MYIPYTYLIGWSSLNLWYYGVRTKENCTPNDLWKEYFTSSKRVTELRKLHGEPDVIQIRKTFTKRREAMEWEIKVLRRLNVRHSIKWINLTIPNVFGANDKVWNKGLTKENNEKLMEISKKISISAKGKKSTLIGTTHTKERKETSCIAMIKSKQPNFPFDTYKSFLEAVSKDNSELNLGPSIIAKKYGVSYNVIKKMIGPVKDANSMAWVKIKGRHPEIPFNSYLELSKYCYDQINLGTKLYRIAKNLSLSEGGVQSAINHWKEANSC